MRLFAVLLLIGALTLTPPALSTQEPPPPANDLSPTSVQVTAEPAPTTYYIDAIEGVDTNPGTSPDRPWQTLDAVNITAFNPGDTVLFRRGQTWSGSTVGLDISSSGTAQQPITYSFYGDQSQPLPTFQATDRFGRAVRLRADWIVIDGLRVADTPYVGFAIGDDRVDQKARADHTRILNSAAENVAIGFALFQGTDTLIKNNTAKNLRLFPAIQTPGPDDDFGAIGFLIQDSNARFIGNACRNCIDDSPDYGVDGSGFEFYAQNQDIADVVISHNQVTNTDNAIEVGGEAQVESGSYTPQYTVSAVVHHNIFTDAKGLHFNLGSYQYAVLVDGFQVHHNTFVRTQTPVAQAVYTTSGSLSGNQLELINNIWYGYTSIARNKDGVLPAVFNRSHNLYYHLLHAERAKLDPSEIALAPLSQDAPQMIHQPFFTDLTGEDYQLIKGSPAIDAGADLAYTQDFNKAQIPQGNRPDIGAFESSFREHSSTDTPDSPDTNHGDDKADHASMPLHQIERIIESGVAWIRTLSVQEVIGGVGIVFLCGSLGLRIWWMRR